MYVNVVFVKLFVQRSEFNSCYRMALRELVVVVVVVLLLLHIYVKKIYCSAHSFFLWFAFPPHPL